MKHFSISVLAAGAALVALAAPANAAVLPSADACKVNDISPTAIQCVGSFSGNAFNTPNLATQNYALNQLGSSLVLTNTMFDALPKIPDLVATGSRTTLAFPGVSMLYGITIVGIHWGGQHDYSSFYKFDAGVNGIASATILSNITKTSNAVLYSTGVAPSVPEPASWAMMIAGFGLAGTAMRRRAAPAVRFA